MENEKSRNNNMSGLRKRAIEIIHKTPHTLATLPIDDIEQLAQELGVYQIELEMQNEELRNAQVELEGMRRKYFDLFELAPVSYFIIDPKGLIEQVNLTGTQLLGMVREDMINQRFGHFICPESQDGFYLFKNAILNSNSLQMCDLKLRRADGSEFFGHLIGCSMPDTEQNESFQIAVFDITGRILAEQNNKDNLQRLQAMTSRFSLTQETEKRQIAEEIHDLIIQPLVFLDVKVKSLQNGTQDKEIGQSLVQIRTVLAELIETSRTVTSNLSCPILYELGLEAAIEEWVQKEIRVKHEIEVDFQVKTYIKDVDQRTKVFLFKSLKELLTNVVKHAKASGVCVSISRVQDTLILCVEDDGRGFEKNSAAVKQGEMSGFGLFSIREQLAYLGGTFNIQSMPDRGSKIKLAVPLESKIR